MKLKRFLVFEVVGYDGDVHGGWDYFLGSYDTLEEARTCFPENYIEIVDADIAQRVEGRDKLS